MRNNQFYLYDIVYEYATPLIAKDLSVVQLFILYLNPLIAIFLSCILGLFSMFFIIFYYTLKAYYLPKPMYKNKITTYYEYYPFHYKHNYKSKSFLRERDKVRLVRKPCDVSNKELITIMRAQIINKSSTYGSKVRTFQL